MNEETTTVRPASRPESTEYAAYYHPYVINVPDGDIIDVLERQIGEQDRFLRDIPESQAGDRYAADKWSIKELVGHLVDSERVFGCRALRFARNDATELPGFDENAYVAAANFDDRTLADLVDELEHVRRANLSLFRHLSTEAWTREGVANGNGVTVRALAYIIAGHARHHMQVLATRYLGQPEYSSATTGGTQ